MSVPGGPFGDTCWFAPVTRIPVGEAAHMSVPSLLDYGFSSRGLVSSSELHWRGAPADLAIVTYSLNATCALQRARKTSWKCTDEQGCIAWIHRNAPKDFVDLSEFHGFLLRMQAEWLT